MRRINVVHLLIISLVMLLFIIYSVAIAVLLDPLKVASLRRIQLLIL
jgi:hypothetical protein